jgi:tight adherence protein C
MTAFYVVAGVTIVWAALRIWQKRRQSQWDRTHAPAEPVRKPASPRRAAPSVAAAPPDIAILKSAPSIVKDPGTAVPGLPLATPPTWEQRQLFGDLRQTGEPTARVLPEDVPTTRTDDFVFGPLTPEIAALLPDSGSRRDETRQELVSAGYYEPHALQNLSAVRYALMMLGVIVSLAALLFAPQRVEWIAIIGLVALPLLGWAVPRLYVRGRAAERRSEIERGMPDVLDMLNMCVSQGLTIPDALRRILRDLRGPYPALAQELRIVSEQAAIGNMHQALDNFSARVDIPEVHSFTSLLTQTERMGTSVSEALASYSDTMRESLRQRADERGNRATFQLLFPTVLCLMPAVYLFLLGPAIIDLSKFFTAGGRDALDQGTQVIQRMNANRRAAAPTDATQ